MTVVHAVRRHVADARVPVRGVVPGEEGLAVRARVLDAAEARREVRPIFHGLELRLREGVVIGNVRPAMALGDVQSTSNATGLERMLAPRSAMQ